MVAAEDSRKKRGKKLTGPVEPSGMSDTPQAAKREAPPVKDEKGSKSDPPKPSTWDMVKSALIASKSRNGSSRVAIAKYIKETYPVTSGARFTSLLRRTLNGNVEKGILGRSGNTFKLTPQAKTVILNSSPKSKPKGVQKKGIAQSTSSRKMKEQRGGPAKSSEPKPTKQLTSTSSRRPDAKHPGRKSMASAATDKMGSQKTANKSPPKTANKVIGTKQGSQAFTTRQPTRVKAGAMQGSQRSKGPISMNKATTPTRPASGRSAHAHTARSSSRNTAAASSGSKRA